MRRNARTKSDVKSKPARIAAAVMGCALAMVAGAAAAKPTDPARVLLRSGAIEGKIEDGVRVFRGVPFAAPPIGPLRWKAPQPVARWRGVRNAKDFAPACAQLPFGFGPNFPELKTSEDCLYLNVWAPENPSGKPLPVMVWIYGGSFTGGATSIPLYSGENLAKKGVIVVSLSYRVGALGFLAHPELSQESGAKGSGNYGLMDLVAGLKWVNGNIGRFGGDPKRVTIFGESAGATAVSMLAASPKAKGLIHGAISESGGAFAPPRKAMEGGQTTPLLPTAEARGTDFLKKLGVATIDEARALPTDQIVQAAGSAPTFFWPVLDGNVLPRDIYELYEARAYNDIPVIAGYNSDEGAMFIPQMTMDAYRYFLSDYGMFSDALAKVYPANSDDEALMSARQLFADTIFRWPTWTWARLQSQTGGKNVFLYRFDRVSGPPPFPINKVNGAVHGAELAYVFGHQQPDWQDDDRQLSDNIMQYWVNFVKTGNPNGQKLPQWPAFSSSDATILHLDRTIAPKPMTDLDQLKALDDYYAWRRNEIHKNN